MTDESDRHKHPSRICDDYIRDKSKCVDCMDPEEEVEFWRECYQGAHKGPEDCPTYYDGCNCGGKLANEVEWLLARCKTLRELADQAAAEQGLAQRRMTEAQVARDEARAEVERLKQELAMAQQVSGELCDKCGWAMKFPGEPCRCELEKIVGTNETG